MDDAVEVFTARMGEMEVRDVDMGIRCSYLRLMLLES